MNFASYGYIYVSGHTLRSPQNPDTANSNHLDSGVFSRYSWFMLHSWEGIAYPTSCLAGFPHYQCEFFPPSSGARSFTHRPLDLPPCPLSVDWFLQHKLCRKHISPLTSFSFPPSGFPGWENAILPVVLVQHDCLSRLTIAQGRGGNSPPGLEEKEIPAWSATFPCAQGMGSFCTLWFGLLWREEGCCWWLKDGIRNG